MLLRTALLVAMPLALAAAPRAQLLHTTTGEALIGHVDSVGDDGSVVVTVGHPEAGSRTFAKGQLIPVSVYDAMRATMPMKTAGGHRQLAKACVTLGLPAQAMAHARIASKIDPDKSKIDDAMMAGLKKQIARAMLKRAREAAAAGRLGEAHLIGSAIGAGYGDTPAAEFAAKMVDRVGGRVVKALAGNEADADAVAKATTNAKRLHDRAVELMGAEGASMLDKSEAAAMLTRAWKSIQYKAPGDNADAQAVRAAIIAQLANAHAGFAQMAVRHHDAAAVIAHAAAIRELDPTDARAAQSFGIAVQMLMMTGFDLE